MKQKPHTLRTATAALFASVALSATPSLAQDAPVVAPPPVVTTPPPVAAPAPVITPPVSVAPAPAPRSVPQLAPASPVSAEPAEAPAARAERPVQRAVPRTRTATPAPRAAPAPAPVVSEPVAATPVTPAPLPEAAPVVSPEATPAVPADLVPATETGTAEAAADNGLMWGLIVAGLGVLIALGAFFALRRRRTEDEYVYEEASYEEPVVAAPVMAAEPEIAEADVDDVAALAAASSPTPGRPWIELLMRPVRAGTLDDEARVEFELTIGNTGSVPARDVRVSTWMFAAGDSEMERSLITPPAGAQRSEMDIEPGDGARVETAIALPREQLRGSVLPVVVADARYRLPDGSEGRTSASFAVGLPNGEGLEPFAVDLPTGMHEDVQAQLHGEAQRA